MKLFGFGGKGGTIASSNSAHDRIGRLSAVGLLPVVVDFFGGLGGAIASRAPWLGVRLVDISLGGNFGGSCVISFILLQILITILFLIAWNHRWLFVDLLLVISCAMLVVLPT